MFRHKACRLAAGAAPARTRAESRSSWRRTAGVRPRIRLEGKPRSSDEGGTAPARRRFLALDTYRVAREWNRLEGTPQRDLFRQLRERFLVRHRPEGGEWAVDVGSGPGRFASLIGPPAGRVVLVDLSREMLREGRARLGRSAPAAARFDFVQADAVSPPLRPNKWSEVVVMGNALGFAGPAGNRLLQAASDLVAPEGALVVEAVGGPGEVSRYLARLPEGAVRRLLAAPVRAVLPRVAREGFRPLPPRRAETRGFRRWRADEVNRRLGELGFEPREAMAVAPALGAETRRVAAVRGDGKAWAHLLELEETLGRDPVRVARASAYLLAARRTREVRAE